MKPWYKSRTLWLNALTLLAVVIVSVTAWPELQRYGAQMATALAVVNMLLRFMTTQAIGDDDKKN